MRPVRLAQDLLQWRSASARMLGTPQDTPARTIKYSPPRNLRWVGRLVEEGHREKNSRIGSDALGVGVNDRYAKYQYWRHKRMHVLPALLDSGAEAVGNHRESICDCP